MSKRKWQRKGMPRRALVSEDGYGWKLFQEPAKDWSWFKFKEMLKNSEKINFSVPCDALKATWEQYATQKETLMALRCEAKSIKELEKKIQDLKRNPKSDQRNVLQKLWTPRDWYIRELEAKRDKMHSDFKKKLQGNTAKLKEINDYLGKSEEISFDFGENCSMDEIQKKLDEKFWRANYLEGKLYQSLMKAYDHVAWLNKAKKMAKKYGALNKKREELNKKLEGYKKGQETSTSYPEQKEIKKIESEMKDLKERYAAGWDKVKPNLKKIEAEIDMKCTNIDRDIKSIEQKLKKDRMSAEDLFKLQDRKKLLKGEKENLDREKKWAKMINISNRNLGRVEVEGETLDFTGSPIFFSRHIIDDSITDENGNLPFVFNRDSKTDSKKIKRYDFCGNSPINSDAQSAKYWKDLSNQLDNKLLRVNTSENESKDPEKNKKPIPKEKSNSEILQFHKPAGNIGSSAENSGIISKI